MSNRRRSGRAQTATTRSIRTSVVSSRRVNADYARLTGGRELPVAEMRAVAEEVREPWRQGGPVMQRTTEHVADTDAGPVRLRIYDPGVDRRPAPALVYMHGGGWTLFSLDTHDRVMREYAARAGVVVVGVDYALSPEARFPVALNQVVAVVRWLHDARRDARHRRARGSRSAATPRAATCRSARRSRCATRGRATPCSGLLLIYPAFDRHCSPESMRRFGGPGRRADARRKSSTSGTTTRAAPTCSDNPLATPMRARLEGPAADLPDDPGVRRADRAEPPDGGAPACGGRRRRR